MGFGQVVPILHRILDRRRLPSSPSRRAETCRGKSGHIAFSLNAKPRLAPGLGILLFGEPILNAMNYTDLRRLEEAIRRAAQQHGFGGDPFGSDPPLGTLGEELAAVELILEIPLRLREFDDALAQRMSSGQSLAFTIALWPADQKALAMTQSCASYSDQVIMFYCSSIRVVETPGTSRVM